MSLSQRLKEDLTKSLKEGNKVRVSVLRLTSSEIKNAEIAKGASLEEGDILSVISKQAKQRRESIESFKKGNRQDLVEKEEAELAILQEYLPEQLSREEISTVAQQIIEEVGARGPGDKGKVMSKIMAQLKGKAEGQEINAVVTDLLASL